MGNGNYFEKYINEQQNSHPLKLDRTEISVRSLAQSYKNMTGQLPEESRSSKGDQRTNAESQIWPISGMEIACSRNPMIRWEWDLPDRTGPLQPPILRPPEALSPSLPVRLYQKQKKPKFSFRISSCRDQIC